MIDDINELLNLINNNKIFISDGFFSGVKSFFSDMIDGATDVLLSIAEPIMILIVVILFIILIPVFLFIILKLIFLAFIKKMVSFILFPLKKLKKLKKRSENRSKDSDNNKIMGGNKK